MEFEKNEKVLAMYRAVCTLLDEGNDLHKLKVSDITAKAGIGKGTAYEYFRSKEELVAKALYYDFFMQYYELENNVKATATLKDAMDCCFTWLFEQTERPRLAMYLIENASGLEKKQERREEQAECCYMKTVDRILDYLVQIGKKDGTINTEISSELASLQLLSQLLAFFSMLQRGGAKDEKKMAQARAFLYGNIVRSLKEL